MNLSEGKFFLSDIPFTFQKVVFLKSSYLQQTETDLSCASASKS